MTRLKALSSKHLAYKINDDDHNPPHVHIEGGGASVRMNLLTLQFMDRETGFSNSTLRKILEKVRENRWLLLDEWEKKHGQD
jgi:hypothetical protein